MYDYTVEVARIIFEKMSKQIQTNLLEANH